MWTELIHSKKQVLEEVFKVTLPVNDRGQVDITVARPLIEEASLKCWQNHLGKCSWRSVLSGSFPQSEPHALDVLIWAYLLCVGKYLLLLKFKISDSETALGIGKTYSLPYTGPLFMLLHILMASCVSVRAYTKECLMDCSGGGLVHLFAFPWILLVMTCWAFLRTGFLQILSPFFEISTLSLRGVVQQNWN